MSVRRAPLGDQPGLVRRHMEIREPDRGFPGWRRMPVRPVRVVRVGSDGRAPERTHDSESEHDNQSEQRDNPRPQHAAKPRAR